MKHTLLAAAVMLAATNGYALQGKVVDEQGQAIVNATVKVNGTSSKTVTDENGRFNIEGEPAEIHVAASGYSHKMLHLHEADSNNLIIKLVESTIEQVDVIGIPGHASVIESALPVSVISGDKLRESQAATLGDTLGRLPGVNSSFHGNVASTPVIRGLSGPRVLITQNSLDVSDVSRVGPDHSVATDASTAQQVEVLRGPATLFYGSGAIGGVVNVVDKRVPADSETEGEVLVSHESVNKQNLGSFNAKTGTDRFAFYADGFWREADDYHVPVAPEVDHPDSGEDTVANSAEESSAYTIGTSYLLDNGYVGLSLGRLDREYGIPGHSHGGEEAVYADLEQDRYQLLSELDLDSAWLSAVNTRAAYTDYNHAEIENGEVATVFTNQTAEIRVDFLHQEWNHWKGGVNIHYKTTDIGTDGEEAFTPSSTTETLAFAVMEEKHFGDVLVQFGARAERVSVTADSVLLPENEFHGHEDEEHEEEEHEEEEHEDHEEHGETAVFAVDQEFTPFSVSLGAVWEFSPGYNVGVSISQAKRAPSAAELLSFGPHIGSGSYEIGALFDLHEEDDESHFELNEASIDLEASNNLDLTFRKYEGDVGIILNAFYNQIDNYYYQAFTGLYIESAHEHDEEHEEEHEEELEEEHDEHEDELPVYLFTSADATLFGFEAQGIWKISDRWKTSLFSDYVQAELDEGAYLPRTPPVRVGADLDFTGTRFNASFQWTYYASQNQVAALETTTDSYTMLDASLSYRFPMGTNALTVFVKADNLTDTEARVHSSFIKDIAPLPGRNFSLGLRGTF